MLDIARRTRRAVYLQFAASRRQLFARLTKRRREARWVIVTAIKCLRIKVYSWTCHAGCISSLRAILGVRFPHARLKKDDWWISEGLCFCRAKNGSQANRLDKTTVRAGSAHAAVPEEEACVGLDHLEGVATGAWSFGHGVVDVGFGGGIGLEISCIGRAGS